MNFDIVHQRYCTLEGRTLLKVNIMQPSDTVTFNEKYISNFVEACQTFARERLYLSLLVKATENRTANTIYSYNLKIAELYHSDLKSSYALYAVFESNGVIIASGLKVINFEDDKIIPSKLFDKRLGRKRMNLATGTDGKLTSLSLLNGILKTEDPC